MKINSINLYTTQNIYNKTQNKNVNFGGTPRVDKSMLRFAEVNADRFPFTVKKFLEGLTDKFKFTPLEAQKEAFIELKQARTIDDVKKLFPQEELFINLKQLKDTKAAVGLLAIYREFKDIFENGILTNGEDLSVYLLKKIFLDSKTLDEINADIDKDLNPDIKNEFRRRNPNSDYILSSTLKALGITRPDTAYQNSLKFTREGYSDEFGLKISQAQLKYWNSLTDEQKFEILSKRCEGRDNWWNQLSYEEKLELAAGVDSEDDLYRAYKKFVRTGKKEIREGKSEQNLERPTKKIKIGPAKLNDKDIFNLWFRKNIEKFYSFLSEADKDSVHIKRVRKLAVRWQEMTPEEKTELINKMREGREPLRFAMIDTWNHSRVLIRELSEFLKSQQILKPVDLLYSTEEFSEFQSKVMTEFWNNHRDLAEEFGKNLSRAIARVESSIQRGQFEDLKQEILRDRAERIRILNWEKAKEEQKVLEEQKAKELERKSAEITVKPDYKEEFRDAFRLYMNKDKILPPSYVDEAANNMLEDLSQDIIEKITEAYNSNSIMSEELINAIKENKNNKKISSRMVRLERALEAAISNELYAKSHNPNIFAVDSLSVFGIYKKIMHDQPYGKKRPDANRILRLYNEYQKDLTDSELKEIVNNYFILETDKNLEEDQKLIADYVASYGKSALILFSDKNAYPNEIKNKFNEKFLKLMPQRMKEICVPFYRSLGDIIAEQTIQQIRGKIARRFDFMPSDFLNSYTQEVAATIRIYKVSNISESQMYSIESFQNKMCKKRTKGDNSSSYLKIPKYSIPNTNKIKVLAAEQALADELYRITGSETVYGFEIEELCNAFEMFSNMEKGGMELADENRQIILSAKIKPNKNNVHTKYREYLNELNDRKDDIFDEYNIKDSEELICALNPDENNKIRDEYIRKRIEVYIP